MNKTVTEKDLCLKCGRCCYLTIYSKDKQINTGIRCSHLDNKNLCAVYENRPVYCMTAKKMKLLKLLPEGCGYHNERSKPWDGSYQH